MDRTSRALLPKVIIDFSCVAIIGFMVLMMYLYAQPYQRGFFCNDESLRHPFHDSTVTNLMLYIIGIALPLCVMIIGEYFYLTGLNGHSSTMQFRRYNFTWVKLVYEKVGIFLFGAAVTVFTTDVAKYTIGRLRPHFIDVCRPDIDCTRLENQHIYFEHFNCTTVGLTERLLKEARLSFPSGHSSFSAYVMIYLTLYLQLRMTWKGARLLRPFLQALCLISAWFTAMSRVSNYKHHWSDVLCGMLIGIIVSLITFFCIGDFFKNKQPSDECMMSIGDSSTRNNVETPMQDEISPLRSTDAANYGGVTIDGDDNT